MTDPFLARQMTKWLCSFQPFSHQSMRFIQMRNCYLITRKIFVGTNITASYIICFPFQEPLCPIWMRGLHVCNFDMRDNFPNRIHVNSDKIKGMLVYAKDTKRKPLFWVNEIGYNEKRANCPLFIKTENLCVLDYHANMYTCYI